MGDNGNWGTVASRTKLGDGDVLGVSVGEEQIALYKLGGELYPPQNICTRAFVVLSDGGLDGEAIECPLHAGRFEVKTGKGLGPPIPCDIKTYPVRVVGDDVQVQLGG